MNKAFQTLASLKLTVILVLLIAVVLSAGTILESLRGAEQARSIYYAPWFFALQGLFALNLVAALIDRWPQNRYRIGFAVTHISMLIILAGALVTAVFKVEGQLPIWEGESSSTVLQGRAANESFELPFKLRVDSFEIDRYQGTMMPSMFRSRVTVLDPAAGERAAVIEMNKPLSYGGFTFFQSSYQIQNGREATILSVSRDPGQAIVFLGYVLLVAGMIVVFVTRLAQHREAERLPARGASRGLAARAGAVVLALLGLALAAAGPAKAAQIPDAATTARVRTLPVQHDGRTMPFDTQAREAVRKVTGKRAWPGIDPVAMALGWSIDPQGWGGEPIVRVSAGVAELAGLPRGTRYASFRSLVESPGVTEASRRVHARMEADEDAKPTPEEKELLAAEERLGVLDGYFRGQAIRAVPALDPNGTWQVPAGARSAAELAALEGRIRADAPAHYPQGDAVDRELGYNAARPTRLGWWLLVPAALAAALTLERDRWNLDWVAKIGLVGGFAVLTWGLATRWQIAGRVPASNMYESMLFLAWGVALVGLVAVGLRNRMLLFNTAAMSALVTALLDLLPIDPFIHPMPPVLSGTPWLAIHVPIIMIGYACLAIVAFFGHLVVGAEIFAPQRRDLATRWSELLYWYTHIGSILLLAGILTGSIWAASSWGRYWGWDPKEVWSLVAFLAYMAILHARSDGQIRSFAVAAWSVAAFWTILMTYLGVNFVLASGLHSYGFGSSNLVRIMSIILVVEVAFLTAGYLAHRRRTAD